MGNTKNWDILNEKPESGNVHTNYPGRYQLIEIVIKQNNSSSYG